MKVELKNGKTGLFSKVFATLTISGLMASGAVAATATGDMDVSATVTRTCTVAADPLAFSTVATGAATQVNAGITVSCSAGSANDAPTISFSNGQNHDATLRNLKGGDSGTAVIPYVLSSTSGGTNLGPSDAVATTASNGGTQYTATVHGKINASSDYQIGSFSDTVTVTVTYSQ